MDTRRIDQGFSFIGAVNWAAIASGAFIALAIETLLLLFGLGVSSSTGDGTTGNGFAVWAIIVQLCAISIGAALTARLSHMEGRPGGAAAGVMTWAVALVLGGALQGIAISRGHVALGGAWTAFLAALISLGGAIFAGTFGASLGRPTHTTLEMPTVSHY